jgi:hypothetical protein
MSPDNRNASTTPLRDALDWRLLLAWTLAMLIPTAVATTPLGHALGVLLDHVPKPLADKLGLDAVGEAGLHLRAALPAIMGGAVGGAILALLFWPFTAALVVARYQGRRSFFALVAAAWSDWGRMFRMLLVALIPLVPAIVIGGGLSMWAGHAREHALHESAASRFENLARAATVVLIVLAQLTAELGRAQLAANPEQRSALRAWIRGLGILARRPGAALGRYLLPTLLSLGAALLLATLRVRVASPVAGFVITQLAVAAIGWGRAARIFELASLR